MILVISAIRIKAIVRKLSQVKISLFLRSCKLSIINNDNSKKQSHPDKFYNIDMNMRNIRNELSQPISIH